MRTVTTFLQQNSTQSQVHSTAVQVYRKPKQPTKQIVNTTEQDLKKHLLTFFQNLESFPCLPPCPAASSSAASSPRFSDILTSPPPPSTCSSKCSPTASPEPPLPTPEPHYARPTIIDTPPWAPPPASKALWISHLNKPCSENSDDPHISHSLIEFSCPFTVFYR